MKSFWFYFSFVLTVAKCSDSGNSDASTSILQRNNEWKTLANSSFEPFRKGTVAKVLSEISGIYQDKGKAINTRLEKTVLINVIETTDTDTDDDKYSHYLKNLLCFCEHYNYETVVYIIEANSTKYELESKKLTSFSPYIHTLRYPYELFWNTLSEKPNEILSGFTKADYQGSTPSIRHFGAFLKLIPMLEALQLGGLYYYAVYLGCILLLVL